MNISCDVIKDILPLYAENMASQATRELVDEHLCRCEHCTAELNALKQPQVEAEPETLNSLRSVAKSIRKRRFWTAATAVLLALTFGFWLFSFMTLLIPATYEETIESVALLEDGSLQVIYKPTASLSGAVMMQSDANVALLAYTSRLDRLFPQESHQNAGGIVEIYGSYAGEDAAHTQVNYWYFDGEGESIGTLLYDAGREVPEEIPWSGNQTLFGFFVIAATVGALLTGLAALLKEHRWVGRTLAVLAGAFSSYAVSTLLLTVGRMAIYNSGIVSMYLIHIVILAVLLFASGACTVRLRALVKAE